MNRKFALTCESEGERYIGSRLDRNGTIVSAKYHCIEMLGEEKPLIHRDDRLYGRGLHNEFGIKRPIGYDDDSEWFPKIGTGWLKKDKDPYFFYTQYEVDRLEFDYALSGTDTAIFICNSGIRNGYGYEYKKTISLKDNGFVVSYELKNIGEKVLETDEYVHNFFRPAGIKIGKGLEVSFPWEINRTESLEVVDPCNIFQFEKDKIVFTGKQKKGKDFYLACLSGSPVEKGDSGKKAKWTITDTRIGFSIVGEGNFNVEKADLWGTRICVSPEMFFSFSIKPEETVKWERKISFFNS